MVLKPHPNILYNFTLSDIVDQTSNDQWSWTEQVGSEWWCWQSQNVIFTIMVTSETNDEPYNQIAVNW